MVHFMHNKRQMTMEEFQRWLKVVDANGDGQISRKELEDALRTLGVHSVHLRAWFAVQKADLNHNRAVDGDQEIKKLTAHAEKHWGIVLVTNN
ncbi:hypothetical protein ACMD2_04883 [Ananas comosus]|uniref:EF-hand domain-containing protein n=1 Tax=Ananas comosus TaxID=4615 RepID=A0A199UMW2_ANACO|nr:hypothetical protein ACMD2_04883 [Ananas comosus]